MANPYNQPRKRGKGVKSSLAEQVRRSAEDKVNTSQTAMICGGGKYLECSEGIEESIEDYLVPRRSLTRQLHLTSWPQEIEVESNKANLRCTPDKEGVLREVTNPSNRVVWKSDRTLLTKGKPCLDLEFTKFTRVTHYTKRRVAEPELPAIIEVSTINELDNQDPNFPIFKPTNLRRK